MVLCLHVVNRVSQKTMQPFQAQHPQGSHVRATDRSTLFWFCDEIRSRLDSNFERSYSRAVLVGVSASGFRKINCENFHTYNFFL